MQIMQSVLESNCIRTNHLKIADNIQYSCYLSYYDNLASKKTTLSDYLTRLIFIAI